MGYMDLLVEFLETTFSTPQNSRLERTGEEEFLDYNIANALEIFKKRNDKIDGRSDYFIGLIYEMGYGIINPSAKNYDIARKHMIQGADRGDSLCAVHLCFMLDSGVADKSSVINRKRSYLITLAKDGDVFAMNELERITKYKNSDDISWNEKAAQAGYWKSMLEVSQKYMEKGNYGEAFRYAEMATNRGCKRGFRILARLYIYGMGVKIDLDKGIKLLIDYNMAEPNLEVECEIGRAYELNHDMSKALEWYKKAASKLLDKSGLLTHGEIYCKGLLFERGIDTVKSDSAAASCFSAAAARNIDAKYKIAIAYLEGKGETKDEARAVSYLKDAASHGHLEARYRLALCYEQGIGVKEDKKFAQNIYEIVAKNDHPCAQYRLANLLLTQKLPVTCINDLFSIDDDIKKAIPLLERAIEHDYKPAYYLMGIIHKIGFGIQLDMKKAFECFCKFDTFAPSQFEIGLCYYYGKGVQQDYHAAFEWLKKAVDNKDLDAKYYLGALYLDGEGVKKDVKAGIDLMLSSADSGNISAKAVLSYYYCHGVGVKTDYKIARELFESCRDKKLEIGAKILLEEVKKILESLDKYKPSIESVLSKIDIKTTKMFLDILK